MATAGKLLFRVDAGFHIGLGHLQRCLALATALGQRDVDSYFLTNWDNGSQERVERLGFSAESLTRCASWAAEDMERTVEVAARQGCRSVMVDSQEVNPDYLAELRDAGLFVVARDDLASHPFPCQMVVNGNADGCRLPYRSSSGDTVFLLGPRYFVLRPEFWEQPKRDVGATVSNVLVILGGADRDNLMPRILSTLDEVPGRFTVTAVVGPYFHNVQETTTAAREARRSVRLVHSPDSVRDLILQSDLAVSAAGQTLHELACMGCPTVAIRTASNQDGQLRALAEAGFLRAAGNADEDEVIPKVKAAVSALVSDAEARAAMAAEGQRLVDGQGALRVARTIQVEAGKKRVSGVVR